MVNIIVEYSRRLRKKEVVEGRRDGVNRFILIVRVTLGTKQNLKKRKLRIFAIERGIEIKNVNSAYEYIYKLICFVYDTDVVGFFF